MQDSNAGLWLSGHHESGTTRQQWPTKKRFWNGRSRRYPETLTWTYRLSTDPYIVKTFWQYPCFTEWRGGVRGNAIALGRNSGADAYKWCLGRSYRLVPDHTPRDNLSAQITFARVQTTFVRYQRTWKRPE